jgi:rubrerythrin
MSGSGSTFPRLAHNRKLKDAERVRAIHLMAAAEHEAIQLFMQLAESTGNKPDVKMLTDTADAERAHADRVPITF